MNFSLFASLFLCVSAAACCSKLGAAACVDLITKDIYSIGNHTRDVGLIAHSVEPNCVFTLLKLQNAATTLVDAIDSTVCDINRSCGNLTLAEGLPLVPVINGLLPTVKKAMELLVSKKCVLDHSILGVVSVTWLVRSDLDQNIAAVQRLSAALRSKLPSSATQIVDTLSAELLHPIKEARKAFNN